MWPSSPQSNGRNSTLLLDGAGIVCHGSVLSMCSNLPLFLDSGMIWWIIDPSRLPGCPRFTLGKDPRVNCVNSVCLRQVNGAIFTAKPERWAANNPIHAKERWQRWCVMDVLLIFSCSNLVIVARRLKAWIVYVYSKKPTSHYFHCKVEAALPTSIQSQVIKITQSDLAGAAGALYSWSTPRKLG